MSRSCIVLRALATTVMASAAGMSVAPRTAVAPGVTAPATPILLTGTVHDSAGGPIAGATVQLAGAASAAARNDEGGRFALRAPAIGRESAITVRRIAWPMELRSLASATRDRNDSTHLHVDIVLSATPAPRAVVIARDSVSLWDDPPLDAASAQVASAAGLDRLERRRAGSPRELRLWIDAGLAAPGELVVVHERRDGSATGDVVLVWGPFDGAQLRDTVGDGVQAARADEFWLRHASGVS